MKPFQLIIILVMSCWGSQDPAVFVGSTPCSERSRPLPGMAAEMPCEFMKWRLTLYPKTFELHCAYGMTKPGTKDFADGGRTIDLKGEWMATETSGIPVVRLTDVATNRVISFRKLNDDVLHLLDSGGHLMIGSAAWSYTLNRIK
ncbi:MAG: hypothetical protein JST68_04745 [Bacteroidetes bacterium]|nr:hypothetical protein [Bacteroidota bacterium]